MTYAYSGPEHYSYDYGKTEEATEPVRFYGAENEAQHGVTSYRHRGRRCAVCRQAKRIDSWRYRERRKAQM